QRTYTSGLFAKLITDIEGAGQIFKGDFIVYSNETKIKLAGVSSLTLKKYGAI
ncbi:39589_t:CDS:1, partial [Gigaspora margarita]